MKGKRLFVRIEADLLKRIDRQAKRIGETRSNYIRAVLTWAVEAAEEAKKNFENGGES